MERIRRYIRAKSAPVPRGTWRAVLMPYAKALLIVAAGTLLRLWMDPDRDRSAFVISFVAMLLASWAGGLSGGLLAQTVAILIELTVFVRPAEAPPPSLMRALSGLGAYYFVGVLVAVLGDAMRAAERRAAAEAQEARAQREQLRATLSCIGDAVLATDAHGLLTMMNPAAELLTGWTSAAAVGRPIDEIFCITDERSQQSAESPVTRVLSVGSVAQCQQPLRLMARDGRWVPVDYSAAPIRDGDGRTTGIVLSVRDETERRRREQELRDADRRKDEFLATLAHELRNPLAPISTGLALLKLAAHEPKTVDEVRTTMERQTQHMVRLIDDLLDVSRITRGKLQLRQKEVELAEVVRNAVDATQSMIDQARHRLAIRLPATAIRIFADPNRLAQVLTNLLHNAAKYTPSGGQIELTVTEDARHIRIAVSDTGLGIPSEMHERIFDMFTQVNGSMEMGGGGLGIGLTLVKSLVEMHGGTIEVESAGANQGSRFTVVLPAELRVTAIGQTPPEAPTSVAMARRRVLVVDDNRDAAETLGTMVGLLGHEVKIAFDGADAVAAAESWQPDVILMDIGMPRMNGYEAARQIRGAGWGREMLLIATTGWGQEDDRRRTKEAGFDHHLVKPVEAARVQELLAGVCTAATA